MSCKPTYDELMSLKLDNLLDPADERGLQAHLAGCEDCSLTWQAMSQADALLCSTATAPVPVPANFHASVMLKISQAQVYRPQLAELDSPVPMPVFAPALGSVLPAPAPQPVRAGAAGLDEDAWQEWPWQQWQRRLSQYLRGAAAVGLSVAGTSGLVIALMLSDVIKVEGPFAGFLGMLRTFLSAVNAWLGSLFTGVGAGTVAGVSLVMGIMLLAAWQLVAAYHRTAEMQHGNIGQLAEAAS
ncbi:MAG TPA: anti-sigma factor [Chloroflexia bacterium]|nr:anti-sigma factor [Chloroflexia bacterium]